MLFKKIFTVSVLTGLLALAQNKPAPAPAAANKPAAAPSPVDTIIQLKKGGMSESMIIKTLQKQNQPMNLTPAEMLKLQKAGISENIMNVMQDPASAVAGNSGGPASKSGPAAPAVTDCPAPAAVAPAVNAGKRRLAVDAFDYSAVRNNVTAIFGNDVQIGQGIRAMLTAKMGEANNVVLLEREKLKSVMGEQDLGGTNRINQGTKAKIGKITGADAMLYGDIVIFGRDDTAKRNNTSAFIGMIPGPVGIVGGALSKARKTDKAVVAINLRLVDAETGEVIASAQARGESSRTSTDFGAMAGTFKGAAATNSSMTSSNFQSTIIGEATDNAVTKIVAFLNDKIPSIGAKSRTIEGRVATLEGCTLYLSVGANDGVHVGDHFEIHRIIKEVIDPETKEVLDKETEKVGDFIAGTVRDKMTIGQYGGPALSNAYLTKPGFAARMATQ